MYMIVSDKKDAVSDTMADGSEIQRDRCTANLGQCSINCGLDCCRGLCLDGQYRALNPVPLCESFPGLEARQCICTYDC